MMTRRRLLAGAGATYAAQAVAQSAPIPIIDTHIHFFDTTRPQGVPYGQNFPVGPIASPAVFKKEVAGMGIVGAIEVEASPWIEDNLWVLMMAQADPLMVGFIGNLEPQKSEFREYLDRYRKNPLFRGIRCGNIWNRNLMASIADAEFVAGIKQLAAADLIMDTANPSTELIEACVRLTDKVPELRLHDRPSSGHANDGGFRRPSAGTREAQRVREGLGDRSPRERRCRYAARDLQTAPRSYLGDLRRRPGRLRK